MDARSTPLRPEDLLAQAGWVRKLAGRLVADPGLREDVAQQALLTALERRPSLRHPAAWVTRLVRNIAWQVNRSERSRREHEQSAPVREPAVPVEDLIAEAELQRRVVDAVLALDEPYRSTLLQRFFRDRSAEEIARREGIPAATVRSRLKRGLDHLRHRFGDEQQTNRGCWLALILPATRLESAAVAATTSLTVGGIVMSAKTVVSGLALAVLITAAVVLGTSGNGGNGGGGGDGGNEPPAATAATQSESFAPATPATTLQTRVEETQAASTSADTVERERVKSSGTVLAGQVVDAATSAPVESFFVLVSHRSSLDGAGDSSPGTVVRERVSAPDGRFHFPLEQQGVYRLEIYSPRHSSEKLDDLRLEGAGITDLVVQLDSGRTLSGRVIDDRSRRPIEGVIVGTAQGARSDLKWLLRQEPERCLHAETDAEGAFTLSGLTDDSQKIAAVHPNYAEGWQQLVPSEVESVEIRLRRGAVIHGTVYGDDGRPKEGVWIRLHGGEIPLHRTLVTGPGGTYRTPPVRPGTVELYACPPGDEDQDEFGFSSEWQVVKLEDADVRLDFGVCKEYATWRGTLYGEDGEPEAGARIRALYRPPDYTDFEQLESHSRTAFCDPSGRFEFRKLPPGQYRLFVSPTDRPVVGTTPFIHLKNPGLLEEDIHLESPIFQGKGGEIHGLVVEDGTQAPVQPEGRCYVSASTYEPVYRYFRADLDEQGRFHLKGLPPGAYSVFAHVGERLSEFLRLIVQPGEVIRDVRLALLPMGRLRLRLLDFREFHPRTVQYSIEAGESNDGNRSWSGDGDLAENGSFEQMQLLEAGSWRVLVTVLGLGQAEHSFRIRPDLVTKVDFRPADLIVFADVPRTFTVEGTLSWADGPAIANQYISFYADQVAGVLASEKSTGAITNEEGEFTARGMRPGRYRVTTSFGQGTKVNFDDLVIPLSASDPVSLRLVVPGGTVGGDLYDGRTGQALDEEGPMWWIFLHHLESRKNVAEIQGGHTGPRFELKGVASGEYQLTVSARGYERYVSEPFHYGSRFAKELGRINLKPCGTFEFEVVDTEGQAISAFHIYANGQVLPWYRRISLDDGRFRHAALPLGEITLAAAADGYVTSSITVTLEAGKPGRHRFVLSKRDS